MIDVKHLSKSFGDQLVLDDLTEHVSPGERMVLLGPSGSGKTTLLRCVAGLEIPTGGQILFGGEDASFKSVQERQIGFVFQHYALFKHLTIADNISYGLRVRPRRTRPTATAIRD